MEAVREPERLAAAARLAQAPTPPRTTPGLTRKSAVNTFVGFIKNSTRRTSRSAATVNTPSPCDPVELSYNRGSRGRKSVNEALFTNSPLAYSPLSQRKSEVQPPPVAQGPTGNKLGDSSQAGSSTNAEDSLFTSNSQATSETSVSSNCFTKKVQGYWVSNMMPDKELQNLWIYKIQDRLAMELLVNIQSGGWVAEFSMVGKSQNDLTPHILVTCLERQTKREVERLYKSLGWLRELLKRHHIRLITFHATVRLSALNRVARTPYQVLLRRDLSTYCGSILEASKPGASVRPLCTLGGLILVDGRAYGVSVGHAFLLNKPDENLSADTSPATPAVSSMPLPENQGSDEFDSISSPGLFDENDEPSNATPLSSIPSREDQDQDQEGLARRLTQGAQALLKMDSAFLRRTSNSTSSAGKTPVVTSSADYSHDQLDWAIIEFGADMPVQANRDGVGNFLDDTVDVPEEARQVSILADGGQLHPGLLNPLPVTLSLDRQHYKAFRISIDRQLFPGLSGAWVVLNGKVCGHIIALRDDTSWAYMQPIRPILRDIGKKLGTDDVKLLPHSHPLAVAGERNRKQTHSYSMMMASVITPAPGLVSSQSAASDRDIAGKTISRASDRTDTAAPSHPGTHIRAGDTPESPRRANPEAPQQLIPNPQKPSSRQGAPPVNKPPWPRAPTPSLQSSWRTLRRKTKTRRINDDASRPELPKTAALGRDQKPSSKTDGPRAEQRNRWQHNTVYHAIANVPATITRPFESFVLRHEFRMRRGSEFQPRLRCPPRRSRLVRAYHYSVAGSLYRRLVMRIYPRNRVVLRLWETYVVVVSVVFALFYYVLCMPCHWWVANKYRDLLERTEERRLRRARGVDLLGADYRLAIGRGTRWVRNEAYPMNRVPWGSDDDLADGLGLGRRKKNAPIDEEAGYVRNSDLDPHPGRMRSLADVGGIWGERLSFEL